jgi:hypothetical protein
MRLCNARRARYTPRFETWRGARGGVVSMANPPSHLCSSKSMECGAGFAARNLDFCLFPDHLTTELNADVGFLPAPKRVHDKYRLFLSGIIAEGIAQGLVNNEYDPKLSALAFIAIRECVLHGWSLHRSELNGRTYVKDYRRLIMGGLTV